MTTKPDESPLANALRARIGEWELVHATILAEAKADLTNHNPRAAEVSECAAMTIRACINSAKDLLDESNP